MSNNQKDYLLDLIEKLQKGVISKKEIEFLANFFESHQNSKEWPMDDALKEKIKQKIYTKIHNEIKPVKSFKQKVRNLNTKVFKYAAAVVILITVGFLSKDFLIKEKPVIVNNNIQIGTDKAILTLEDGTDINLEKGKSYASDVLNSNGIELLYKKNIKVDLPVAYNYLTVPRGGEFYTMLADGTKIWLNSESKLKYPTEFKNGTSRDVELLYGEAFFDVSSSELHGGDTFKVITKGQTIEVLGTQFNLKAYIDDETIVTTLIEGRISIDIDGKKEYLYPLQQSIYNLDSKAVDINEIDIAFDTAWRSGYFNFIQKPFKDVAKVLERWYNVEFSFENEEVANLNINGVLSKNQNIEYFLITLKNIKNIKYQIKGNKILIK